MCVLWREKTKNPCVSFSPFSPWYIPPPRRGKKEKVCARKPMHWFRRCCKQICHTLRRPVQNIKKLNVCTYCTRISRVWKYGNKGRNPHFGRESREGGGVGFYDRVSREIVGSWERNATEEQPNFLPSPSSSPLQVQMPNSRFLRVLHYPRSREGWG